MVGKIQTGVWVLKTQRAADPCKQTGMLSCFWGSKSEQTEQLFIRMPLEKNHPAHPVLFKCYSANSFETQFLIQPVMTNA